MKAHEIARILLAGKDLEVVHVWDGSARTTIEHIWETKGGEIATSDFDMVVYRDRDRPLQGPLVEEVEYWCSPEDPNLDDEY
jgi:hypothetical protein